MEAYLLDWVSLLLRWAHVITAIAWIGASFYFVLLDNSLTQPQDADLKAKGVDAIVCLSVNDAFVMKAWGENQGVLGEIEMIADPAGDFTKAVDLTMDGSKFGLGLRS
ncbi:MAG: urate hydroxylase PuuD, partial [Pseudomonadota bacterium]